MNALCPAAGHVQRASTAGFVRIARHNAHRRLVWRAHVRWLADIANREDDKCRRTLASEYIGAVLPVAHCGTANQHE